MNDEAGDGGLERHNAELRLANENLVLATLAAQQLREEAELMRKRQDEFLAMLAHELRNPLAPIRLAVDVMARIGGEAVPPRLLDVIRRQVHHMARLLDDLLDVSRLTRGKVKLQMQSLRVADFIEEAVESATELVEARNQRLTLDLPAEAVLVHGDAVRLTQVVANLLQNASKYTQKGGRIQLTAAAAESSVEIRVADDGSGIPAGLLPHVFDLFMQDERPLNRTQGGLGIGLTVVKKMVELHGGTVEARSEGEGKGSEFVVRLPLGTSATGEPADTPTEPPAAVAGAAGRLLIIEDNIDMAELLAEDLRLSGHEVETAHDGKDGVRLFSLFRPQVVLCDIGLPGMDGYEVARQVRARRALPRPLLIALTGYGGPQDGTRAREAGFDHHVVKPADPAVLRRLIDAALQVQSGGPARPPGRPPSLSLP